MASDITASSSSQQPFATPQPAPVPTSTTATSPPTKQSLKSWWKTFGKASKNQDSTQGKSFPFFCHGNTYIPKHLRHNSRLQGIGGSSTLANITSQFEESHMSPKTPAREGSKHDMAVASAKGLRRSISIAESILPVECHPESSERLPPRRHSSLLTNRLLRQIKPQRPKSMMPQQTAPRARSPSVKLHKSRRLSVRRRSNWYITDLGNDSSDALGAGIQFDKKPSLFSRLSLYFDNLSSKSYTKTEITVDTAPGIFGIPLRQSITYANVAISLVDADGKSYIYGYVPIVVAKCGVYLKEKGTCFASDMPGSQADDY